METRESESEDTIRRRRRCQYCHQRFTTYERIEYAPSVVKSDGAREDYDRGKVEASMKLALRKRPVPKAALEEALRSIESALMRGGREIASARIGELVMDQLRDLDRVAFIRYASVYRNFDDIEAFATAVAEMKPAPKSRRRS